jgi:hypothetical protein
MLTCIGSKVRAGRSNSGRPLDSPPPSLKPGPRSLHPNSTVVVTHASMLWGICAAAQLMCSLPSWKPQWREGRGGTQMATNGSACDLPGYHGPLVQNGIRGVGVTGFFFLAAK